MNNFFFWRNWELLNGIFLRCPSSQWLYSVSVCIFTLRLQYYINTFYFQYQQQVTVFIVGYENICGQKLRLLQQVNEVSNWKIDVTASDKLMQCINSFMFYMICIPIDQHKTCHCDVTRLFIATKEPKITCKHFHHTVSGRAISNQWCFIS